MIDTQDGSQDPLTGTAAHGSTRIRRTRVLRTVATSQSSISRYCPRSRWFHKGELTKSVSQFMSVLPVQATFGIVANLKPKYSSDDHIIRANLCYHDPRKLDRSFILCHKTVNQIPLSRTATIFCEFWCVYDFHQVQSRIGRGTVMSHILQSCSQSMRERVIADMFSQPLTE